MNRAETHTCSFDGRPWVRPVALVMAVLILPALYATSGFALFDGMRSTGLEASKQSALFGVATAAICLWLFLRAWRSGLPISAMIGALFLLVAAGAVNWDYPAKFVHVPQYALLGAVLAVLLRQQCSGAVMTWTAALLIGFAGFTDELIQGFLSARTFGTEDLVVDFAAGGGGYLLLRRPDRQSDVTAPGILNFLLCCVLPGAAAVAFLVFVCVRSSILELSPPPAAFASLAAASASCLLFATLSRGRGRNEGAQKTLAVCLGITAMGVVAIYVLLVALPLAFR